MIAHVLKAPTAEELDKARNLGMPAPVKQVFGTVVFRREEVAALIREGASMLIILKSGITLECLFDGMTWLTIETYLNQ